jgi:hypothetical protein
MINSNDVSKSIASEFKEIVENKFKNSKFRLFSISNDCPDSKKFGSFEVGIDSESSDNLDIIDYVDFFSDTEKVRVYPRNKGFSDSMIKNMFSELGNVEEDFSNFEIPDNFERCVQEISNENKNPEDLENIVDDIVNQNQDSLKICPDIYNYELVMPRSNSGFADRGMRNESLGEFLPKFDKIDVVFDSHSLYLIYGESIGVNDREAGFLVGIDDTNKFFVHQIDSRRMSSDMEVDESSIRRAIDITHDFDRDNISELLPKFEPSRVQGDLVIEKKASYDNREKALRSYSQSKNIKEELCMRFGTDPAKELMNSTSIFIYNNQVGVDIKKSYSNRSNNIFEEVFGDIDESGVAICCSKIVDELSEYTDDDLRISEYNHSSLTFTVDNHLISVENGLISELSPTSSEPIQLFVPEESEVTVSHHEHPQKRFTLEKGLYEFSLLFEGFYPNGFEPPQW